MPILVTALVLALSGCIAFPSDPAQPMGVRLHRDGTVDLVSCRPLSGITKLEGSTYLRAGWNGVIDDKTEVHLTVETPQVQSLSIGEIVTFSGIPAKWDSMYLDADGAGEAAIQNGELNVGKWTWYGYVHPEHCLAGEGY